MVPASKNMALIHTYNAGSTMLMTEWSVANKYAVCIFFSKVLPELYCKTL